MRSQGSRADSSEAEADYYLGPVVGRGVTGFVYEGFRRTDGLDVVIKVLSKKLARHPKVIERIACDVEDVALADVRHANVARTLGMVQIEGRRAVVVEKVPGKSLATILEENGPLTDRRALKLAQQIAEGLRAAERLGIYHGDLRPGKFHVDHRGRLWITDFGLAYSSCVASRFKKYANIPFGHPEYLAPEVVQKDSGFPDPGADMYALGICLYEMVCGVVPFRGISARNTLQLHLEKDIPPPPEGIVVSENVAQIILKLTAKDPEKRVQTPDEAIRHMKAALSGEDLAEVTISSEAWMSISGAHGIGLDGWDPRKLDPASSRASGEDDRDDRDDRDEEVLPQGDFLSGTGFFKPHVDQIKVADPFRGKAPGRSGPGLGATIASGFAGVWQRLTAQPLLTLSLILNGILIALILTYGLGASRRAVDPGTDPFQTTPNGSAGGQGGRRDRRSGGAAGGTPGGTAGRSTGGTSGGSAGRSTGGGARTTGGGNPFDGRSDGGQPGASGGAGGGDSGGRTGFNGSSDGGSSSSSTGGSAGSSGTDSGASTSRDPLPEPSREETEDLALLELVNQRLRESPRMKALEARAVLVVQGRVWFNIAKLPAAERFMDRRIVAKIVEQRKGYVEEGRRLLVESFPKIREIQHIDVERRPERTLDPLSALQEAIRAWLLPERDDPEIQARTRRLLDRLESEVRKSPDAYFLSVAYAAIGKDQKALHWISEALLRGFRQTEVLREEPLLARVRSLPEFRRLVTELGMPGLAPPDEGR